MSEEFEPPSFKKYLSTIHQYEVSKSFSKDKFTNLYSFLSLIQKTENKVFLNYKFSNELDLHNNKVEQFIIELNTIEDISILISGNISFYGVKFINRKSYMVEDVNYATLFIELDLNKNKHYGLRIVLKHIVEHYCKNIENQPDIDNMPESKLKTLDLKSENISKLKVISIENYNNAK